MAPSKEESYNSHHLSIFAGLGLFSLVALIIHSFTAAVSVRDWLKRRPMTAVDQVITALGVSRVMFQISTAMQMFLEHFCQRKFFFYITLGCFEFIVFLSEYCSIYFSALLSAVYCLKICTFSNVLFQSLKKYVVQRVVCLILVIVLISLLLSSALVYEAIVNQFKNSTQYEMTEYQHEFATKYTYYLISGNIIPFLMKVLSSILLLGFLHLHLRRTKSTNALNAQLGPIYKVLKAISFCFVMYVLQVLTCLISAYFLKLLDEVIIFFILNVFPCIHSIYLIHTTSRLRNHFSRMLHCGINCLLKRRVP